MKIAQSKWSTDAGWTQIKGEASTLNNPLVLVFGSRENLQNESRVSEILETYKGGNIIFASTSGEISDVNVADDTLAVSAIEFEKSSYVAQRVNIGDCSNSKEAGVQLADSLSKEGLSHVFIISDGASVNGTDLVAGLESSLGEGVTVTGGLAGDAARFEMTLTSLNEKPKAGEIVAVGFYGDSINVGYASVGGWDSFGPFRTITKSEGNKLYELDGKSALDLYKDYLGDKAAGLPGTALLFPLSIKVENQDEPLVRTILSIDDDGAMVFAGDIPTGAQAQLMKANFDKLIDGAYKAAELSKEGLKGNNAELAILVSCVGRKLVLDQRVEEEVEEVREILGEGPAITGFYSYGELAPFAGFQTCGLHNQTMTITLFSEN